MGELKDYSGPIKPKGFQWEDFSKETLIKVMGEYARLYLMIDGLWNTIVTRDSGMEAADKWDTEVWLTIPRPLLIGLKKTLNIEGNDVVSLLKTIQFDPGFTPHLFDYDLEVKNNNHVIMNIHKCPSLLYFESKAPEKVMPICHELEPPCFQEYCNVYDSRIKCTPLKLPPRKGPDDVPHCIWEFKLEE
ncbi:DUF6125 family protein [Chloroflexota bacterium]